MSTIVWILALVIWVILFAKLEVEIEGQHGWAEKAPTKRYRWDTKEEKLFFRPFNSVEWQRISHLSWPGNFYKFYICNILGGRDFTTYHRTVDLIQLFVSHAVTWGIFHSSTPWWAIEMRAFAFLMLTWAFEDTLWFVLNPLFGIKKYNKESIPWHAQDWLWIAPKGMMILVFQAVVLLAVSYILPLILK